MNARPRPQPGGPALFRPGVAVSGGALTLAGGLISGGNLHDWGLYPAMAGAALIFGAGACFESFFQLARPGRREAIENDEEIRTAWRFGWMTLITGAALAALAGRNPALFGVGIALLVVLYASVTRPLWGPGFFTYGGARALAVLLGISAVPMGLERYWNTALPVLIYATGWEVLRSARQPGAPRTTALVALAHLAGGVSLALYQGAWTTFHWLDAMPFLFLLLAAAFPRFVSAVMLVGPAPVLQAVQYGLLGEVLLGAMLAAGHNSLLSGLVVSAMAGGVYLALERWPVPLVLEPR
jgi:hypothetical protein